MLTDLSEKRLAVELLAPLFGDRAGTYSARRGHSVKVRLHHKRRGDGAKLSRSVQKNNALAALAVGGDLLRNRVYVCSGPVTASEGTTTRQTVLAPEAPVDPHAGSAPSVAPPLETP